MTFLKKMNLKNVKQLLWSYKYIIAILLVLFIIYYYMNAYIQENLETATSKDSKKFALQIENLNDFDFNINVYKITYDINTKTNSATTELVKSTLIPAKKAVILPAGNTKYPEGFDAKVYLDGGNLGFAIKVSTTDGTEKNISYKLSYCAQVKAGTKKICSKNAPLVGKFKELTDFNFKDSSDIANITIASNPNTKIYSITPKTSMKSYSVGFIYLPSVTSK